MSATVPVQVHFDDLDAMGVVHNGKYVLLIERALADYWSDRGWPFDPTASHFDDIYFVVREFSIKYHVPITAVGSAGVELWIEKLGATSIVYGFRVQSADGSVVHAEGRRVQVKIDRATLRPAPLSGDILAACLPLTIEPEARVA